MRPSNRWSCNSGSWQFSKWTLHAIPRGGIDGDRTSLGLHFEVWWLTCLFIPNTINRISLEGPCTNWRICSVLTPPEPQHLVAKEWGCLAPKRDPMWTWFFLLPKGGRQNPTKFLFNLQAAQSSALPFRHLLFSLRHIWAAIKLKYSKIVLDNIGQGINHSYITLATHLATL